MKGLAPILLVAYNRPHLLFSTLNYLSKNILSEETELFFINDGPKNEKDIFLIEQNKTIVERFRKNFKIVKEIYRSSNIGLKKNVENSINKIFETYDKIIVLEDDLLTSKGFLKYLNEGLTSIENEDKIVQISGYAYLEKRVKSSKNFNSHLLRGGDCLAWGTWKKKWDKYYDSDSTRIIQKFNGKKLLSIDRDGVYPYYKMLIKNSFEGKSWAINWYANTYLNNLYTIYPLQSHVLHIGNDNTGTNYSKSKYHDPLIVHFDEKLIFENILLDQNINIYENAFNQFLKEYSKDSVMKKLLRKIWANMQYHRRFINYQILKFKGFAFNYTGLSFKSEIENNAFREKLKRSKSYLEFGSGSSTILADHLKISGLAIEGDKFFLKKISSLLSENTMKLMWKDIGPVTYFSDPYFNIFNSNKNKRKFLFKKYSDFPKNEFEKKELPDLVLVDGKFRVACALKTLLEFKRQNHEVWTIVIDDYKDRKQYHVVEQFFKESNLKGEMIFLKGFNDFNEKYLEEVINNYELIID